MPTSPCVLPTSWEGLNAPRHQGGASCTGLWAVLCDVAEGGAKSARVVLRSAGASLHGVPCSRFWNGECKKETASVSHVLYDQPHALQPNEAAGVEGGGADEEARRG